MYNIIINIIAWTTIVWSICLIFWHIFLYVWYKIDDDIPKYTSIERTTYFFHTEYDTFYIFPSINFQLNSWYKEIEIAWLKWSFYMSYHLVTEEEENIKAKVKSEMKDK